PDKNNVSEQIDSDIKRIVRETFAEILDIEVGSISDDANFMNDLGGTSLDYFTLINKLDERFGLKIDFGSDYDLEAFGYTVNHFERIIKEMIQ
ncbi:MAG: acyl carrier protein, partial [Clostridia bacterium]|nr:acyl carrier protein [Clostridia bacterium]